MNVKFCEDNFGSSKKMRYFRKISGGSGPPGPFPGPALPPPQAETKSASANTGDEREARGTTGRRRKESETPARKRVDFVAILSFSWHLIFSAFLSLGSGQFLVYYEVIDM